MRTRVVHHTEPTEIQNTSHNLVNERVEIEGKHQKNMRGFSRQKKENEVKEYTDSN